MIFLVVAEALVPSGMVPQPLEVIRGTRQAVARSRRYGQISRIAVRHGLGPYLRGRGLRRGDAAGGREALAQSLRRALEEGGVTFTKLGQLLSTRRDLLPEEFISELAQLQDRAGPAPWEQVEKVIAESLGVPAGQVFAELQPEPAAAASIAQVHKARLRDGEGPGTEVAVKVQRPGIRATVEQDLDILLRLAARLEDRARWARAVGTADVARGFAAAMREELDFRVEARNMTAVAATWAGQQRAASNSVSVVLPALHERLCTEHVLVIDWLDGVSLRAAGELIEDRGFDRTELARVLLRSMVYQITEGGVFHADPHPGNILLLSDGRSPCWTSARSAALTRSSGPRCRHCCWRSGAATPLRSATPCWSWSPVPTRSTNFSWSGPLAGSWRATSRAAPRRPPRCLPTCSAWLPGLSW